MVGKRPFRLKQEMIKIVWHYSTRWQQTFQKESPYHGTMTSVTRSWRYISTTMGIVVLSAEQGLFHNTM